MPLETCSHAHIHVYLKQRQSYTHFHLCEIFIPYSSLFAPNKILDFYYKRERSGTTVRGSAIKYTGIKLATGRPWVGLSPLQISALIEGDWPCHSLQKNSFLRSSFRHNGQLSGTHKGFLISLDQVCHCQTYVQLLIAY